LDDVKNESDRCQDWHHGDQHRHGQARAGEHAQADKGNEPPRTRASIAGDPVSKPRQQHARREGQRPFAALIATVRLGI
jgi:hypothetical protein